MSAGKKYLRCACPDCGTVITYPDYSAGGTSVCSKCRKSVLLPKNIPAPTAPATATPQPIRRKEPIPQSPRPASESASAARKPAAAPPPKPLSRPAIQAQERRGPMRFVLWAMNLAILAAVAIVFMNRSSQSDQSAEPLTENKSLNGPATTIQPPPDLPLTIKPAPPAQVQPSPATPPIAPATTTNSSTTTHAKNLPATPTPPPVTNVPPANRPVVTAPPQATPVTASTNSFAVNGLNIERPRGAKGSKLTYVTGLMQNGSDAKRFGVRVDLYLLDRAGRQVAIATDYTPIIEPRGSWRFRALVLDQRAVSARVKEIKENE